MKHIRYTPKQAEKINKSTYKQIERCHKRLEKLVKISKNTANHQYEERISKHKFPYITKSGTRHELTINEVVCKGLKDVSPETASKILSHKSEIESLLINS